jgi:CHAT domain-containing protein
VLHALGGTGPALLHLACHATTGATPEDSHLVLDGESRLSVARILAAARARPADAPGGLVVLSTCASDLTTSAYDEALTLATAFLAAGAVSVVGSRWPVGDRTTACLMVMFHRYRAVDGLGDRDALRAAQRWMLDPQREFPPEVLPLCPPRPAALADPVAWAPFTHHGR